MSAKKLTVVGTVVRVTFSGAGANSGETIVTLAKIPEREHAAFVIETDTPSKEYFGLFEALVTAMWEQQPVEITAKPQDPDPPKVVKVKRVKPRRSTP